MSVALFAKDRCRRNAMRSRPDVYVDHLVPVVNAQFIKRRVRRDTGVTDENIELPVPLAGRRDESRNIVSSPDIGRHGNDVAACGRNQMFKIRKSFG